MRRAKCSRADPQRPGWKNTSFMSEEGKPLSICPGCGLHDVDRGLLPDHRFNTSGECWHAYCELSAYTITRDRTSFIHQHAVDAYAAQHAINSRTNIATSFALIGLYLAVERGFSGLQVQRAHMRIARSRKQWPEFTHSPVRAALNVLDVLRSEPGPIRDAAIKRWAAAVWAVCSEAHEWTRRTCMELLDVSAS
jgi:hypothetical protein